jgi:hypothetical protein
MKRVKMARPRRPETPLNTLANWRWDEIEQAAYLYQSEVIESDGEDDEKLRYRCFIEIASKLRRTVISVKDRFTRCGPTFAGVREANGKGPKRVSESALADRDRRRAAADRRDFTGTFCGDPPPGYSMLDRRLP